MKRFLLACLGMLFLGAAGLLILHQLVDFPSATQAQPIGGPPVAGAPGAPGAPGPVGGGQRFAVEPGLFKDVIPPLLEALADTDGGVRQLAAATLVKIGPDAVPPLVEALKAKDRDTRANAAYVLGHLSQSARDALPALAKALKDEDKEVRIRAAYAIHSTVSHAEAAAFAAARANEVDAAAGGAAPIPVPIRPLPTGGGLGTGGMLAPVDPGLLMPPIPPTGKPKND
jgi:hypothetical protein